MARSGPNPKPTQLKVLHGTERPEDRERTEPQPDVGEPTKPRGVLPQRAMWYWNKVAPKLVKLSLLTEIDMAAFFLLCTWYAVAEEAAGQIREQGIITTDDRGRERKNRAITVLNQASKEMRLLFGEFGLTPSTRARLDVPDTPKPDDDFFGY